MQRFINRIDHMGCGANSPEMIFMDPLIATALDTARQRGAEYADIRLVSNREQRIVVRNGVVETMTVDESVGLGIRAVYQGAWGFASTRELTIEAADQAAGQAVQIARASASQNGSGQTAAQLLGSSVSSRGSYATPIGVDPFTVPLEDKLALLLEADREMASVPQVTARMANVVFIREERTFANTEGALVTQTIYEAGGGVQATAVGNGETQRRSYPQSHGRQQGCAGWEYVVAMDLPGNARRTAEEAAELLTAEPCPIEHQHRPDHRQQPARPADPRVLRTRGGTRPCAGRRGCVRRHLVSDA